VACKPDIALLELLKRFYSRWGTCNVVGGCYHQLSHPPYCPAWRDSRAVCTCGMAELRNLEAAIDRHNEEKRKPAQKEATK